MLVKGMKIERRPGIYTNMSEKDVGRSVQG